MTAPKLDRRQVLKLEAAAMAALAGGMPVASNAANLVTERSASELKWDKAPCRFCGTGCSVSSHTNSGWRHASSIGIAARRARYSGSDRPACRMNQTGVCCTASPRQARRKPTSRL